jgi:hypothetical protein
MQIANITINDGQATPVAHTFEPIKSTLPALYRESLADVPVIGNGRVSVNNRTTNGLNKVTVLLELPALETATGGNPEGYTAAPAEAYKHQVKAEFILPDRGTVAQRKDLRVLLLNLLANAQIVDLIDELAPPY